MSFNIVKNTLGGKHVLSAKIKSVTSATTVSAVHIYSPGDVDSDGGAWRKKCKGLSWFDEAASATRSARSEFPAMALIVGDTAVGVTIYDLDDPAMGMWMVIPKEGIISWPTGLPTSYCLSALNGRIYIGINDGATSFNFVKDYVDIYYSGAYTMTSSRLISGRGDATTYSVGGGDNFIIASYFVNDIAATVLEGAEIGALGLPIPTVAVATAGGLSVIHGGSGAVYDSAITGAMEGVDFLDGGKLAVRRDNSGSSIVTVYDPNYWADSFGSAAAFVETAHGSASSYIPNFIGSNPVTKHTGNNNLAIGTEAGLNLYKYNQGNPAESAVAYITSAYATGYLVGDCRAAYFAQSKNADRSVKANTLALTGAITDTAVATGAETLGYSGFSASNYLSRASDTDFDFGTTDFSITLWLKSAGTGSYEDYVARTDATSEAGDWLLEKHTNEKLGWYRHSGSTWALIKESTGTVGSSWQQVIAVRRSGVFNWYLNGEFDSSVADTNSYTPSGGSAFTIGRRLDSSNPSTNASFSLLRISATAPSPQQIKEIYEAEKPLFAANAKCLLQGDFSGYENYVRDLAFDKSTDLLTVSQYGTTAVGATKFRGLEAVDTFNGKTHGWNSPSSNLVASAGGASVYSRDATDGTGGTGGVLVDLPALDVRAELNEGEDKLPDDGKLHFSGVTTDATPTVIANIPLAANEDCMTRVAVNGKRYQVHESSNYIDGRIEERFYRRTSGSNIETAGETMKLVNEGAAALDIDLNANTTNNCIEVKVTGAAISDPIVWKASVEVQRISDKLYER